MIAYDSTLPANSGNQQTSSPDVRGTRYGDAFIYDANALDVLAEDGSLFVTTNAAQGTGVTVSNVATLAAGVLAPCIFGAVPTTAKKFVRLHRLWIRFTSIGSGWTLANISTVISTGAVRSSAGTDYLALHSALGAAGYHGIRGGQNPSSVMSALWAGVPITTLGTAPKLVQHMTPRTATIPVVSDEITINYGQAFGGLPQTDHAVVASTTVNHYRQQALPAIVDPGTGFAITIWGGSMAGTVAIEWELIWSER